LNYVLQEARSGTKPSFFDVYLEGHGGTDLEHPDVLCDDTSIEKLLSTNMYNYALFVIYILNLLFF
jgi:hypothetical protein